jgi:hypothetical protein
MAKTKITEWSVTATSNSDVGGIGILGTNIPENFDNALREIMKQLADLNTGVSFIHDTYKIADSDAETKLAKFDAGSITAGQTRTFTFPDASGTLALTSDISSNYLPLAGGTITGFLTLHAAPTNDLHAASKKYVDDNSVNAADPVFTGDAEFENISDGTTAIPATYLVHGSAKAWCNFDQDTSSAIKNSFNVSSYTDTGTGRATIDFIADLDSVDSVAHADATTKSSGSLNYSNGAFIASLGSGKYEREASNGSAHDVDNIGFSVFGDL